MASQIIAAAWPVTGLEMYERTKQHGVLIDSSNYWMDTYSGSVKSLMDAGIITAEHLPGVPGRPKVLMTFYRGQAVPKTGPRPSKDEHYMHVSRSANGLTAKVMFGLSRQEKALRSAVRDAEQAKARDDNEDARRRDVAAYRRYMEDRLLLACAASDCNLGAVVGEHPFALTLDPRDAERLRLLLRDALKIIRSADVLEVGRGFLDHSRAKNDAAFQAFLTDQGLRADGGMLA